MIAENAVGRGKEGNSAFLVQSGLSDKWWRDAMECLRKNTRQTGRQKVTL